MHFSVRRLRIDGEEPDITAGDLEIISNERCALTLVTVHESWHPRFGESKLVVDIGAGHRFRGRAALIRSDGGRWHYFKGAGKLEGLDSSEFD
jgi:hypothetical protein